MRQKLAFKLFGGIQIYSVNEQCFKPISAVADKGIGQKQQMFLTYMLLNSKRKITAAELMERFWADEGANPANSLKNMIHKIRSLLHNAFTGYEELIITGAGCYEWNKNYILEVDVEQFEQLYRTTGDNRQGDPEDNDLKAFELYTGDILPGVSAEWLDHLNTYYKTVYIDICKSLVLGLSEKEKWADVLRICSRAYTVAPEVEEFTLCAMHANISTGLPGQAIREYEEYRDMLWSSFNLVPSDAVEQAYNLAVKIYKGDDDLEEKVVSGMMQLPEEGAFQCGMLIFRNIVQLELRHMARSSGPACVVVLRGETSGIAQLSATDIRRMERILKGSLRAGDPFTRLNRGSFAVLLSGANEENAAKVMERISRDFHSTYPRSHAVLSYHIYPLTLK